MTVIHLHWSRYALDATIVVSLHVYIPCITVVTCNIFHLVSFVISLVYYHEESFQPLNYLVKCTFCL